MTAPATKDRPIIFSAPMVRALLDGRKTQTRRILKPQPEATWSLDPARWHAARVGSFWFTDDPAMPGNHCIRARYAPGDRLWVRENWRQAYATTAYSHGAIYRADAEKALGMDEYSPRHRWTPSIYMPRWLSRLTLIITDVRVQRLQDISEADAIAEGVHAVPVGDIPRPAAWSAKADFAAIWNTINGADAWAANPWVVAVSFKTIRANIDSAEAQAA